MRILLAFFLSLIFLACTSPSEPADTTTKPSATTPAAPAQVTTRVTKRATDSVMQVTNLVRVAGVELNLPAAMRFMTQQEIRGKYSQVPQAAFTDSTITVNLIVNHAPNPVTRATLPAVLAQVSQQIRQATPIVEWLREEIIPVKGRPVGVLSFVSQAIDTQIYNMMFMTEVDGRLWIASYNCTIDKMERGQADANAMVRSLTLIP